MFNVQSTSTGQRLFQFKESHVTSIHHVLQWFFTSLVFIRWWTLLSYDSENVTRKSLIFWTHVWRISPIVCSNVVSLKRNAPSNEFPLVRKYMMRPSMSIFLQILSCGYVLKSNRKYVVVCDFMLFKTKQFWLYVVSYLDCKSDNRSD